MKFNFPIFTALMMLFFLTNLTWSQDIYSEQVGYFLNINLDSIESKAWQEYQDGNYQLAAQGYLDYLQYNARDGSNIYNLACCYGLLGKPELAAFFLSKAVENNFDNLDWAQADPDFDPVRSDLYFDSVVNSLIIKQQELQSDQGEILWINSSQLSICRILVPENYNPHQKYLLVLGLHGYGSNERRFLRLWDRYADQDFIFATLQAPYPFLSGSDLGYSWYRWDVQDSLIEFTSGKMTVKYVLNAVEKLSEHYSISDIYLLGFSQGCGLTYITGLNNPDYFSGLICFGGWLDTTYVSEETLNKAASHLRIFIGHGINDRSVDFENAVQAKEFLESYGFQVDFYEFEGAHQVPAEMLQESEQWMKR